MRILIVSDIHANLEALTALPADYDRLFCLGDLVDYGPDPRACVRWVRDRAAICVRGNHDHAVARGVSCRCSPAYRRLSESTRATTLPLLAPADLQYLHSLPEHATIEAGGVRFYLTHATVEDPLFGYLAASEEEAWARQVETVAADVVLTGHTHVAFSRRVGGKWLLNPGSVGQSKMHGGEAYYAIWEDGSLELHSVPYPFRQTQQKLNDWNAVPPDVRSRLAEILEKGDQA